MSLMTGDEKHDAGGDLHPGRALGALRPGAATWRRRRSTTRTGTASCSPRGTGRWRTTPCSRPRGSSPCDWLAGFGTSTRRSATTRTACWCPGWRSAPARSATACRSPSGRRSACGRRARRPRVVVLVGDAELDEGSNHEAIEYAGAVGLDTPDRRRRWTTSRPRTAGRAGSPARFAVEGWAARDVDGRDHDALRAGPDRDRTRGRPTVVVARVEPKDDHEDRDDRRR